MKTSDAGYYMLISMRKVAALHWSMCKLTLLSSVEEREETAGRKKA
jgi:hypothetical protein